MPRTLTDTFIRTFSPPEKGQVEIWDSKLPGFGLRVSPKGTRSFVLMYRINGRARRMTIGRYPTLSLSTARQSALQALATVSQGKDPAAERAKKARAASPHHFEIFVDEFIEKYAKPRNKDWRETQRLLKREFASVWRGRDIRKIEKSDVLVVLDRIIKRGSPGAANHAYFAIRKLFNWAVERDILKYTPCQGLRAPAKSNSRDRYLLDQELKAVWQASETLGYPFGTISLFLILTGQRLGEVAKMEWDDFDEEFWIIPAERNKSGRPHSVPLTKTAKKLLQSVPRLHERLLFPANKKDTQNHVSGFSKPKKRLDELSGVSDWRQHDIRRTVATGMARLKVEPHIVEKVLNHSTGTFAGVAGVYNRFGYLPEMREALEKWEAHLKSLLDEN